MTNEEAIYKLNSDCTQMICECECCNEVCDCHIDIAIKAIKKQIPKKPIIRMEAEDSEGYGYAVWQCLACRCLHNTEHGIKHCSNCGQAIDWSEV